MNKSSFIISIIATLFASALVSYAGWSEPTGPPTSGSLPAALNESSAEQAKLGGLQLNLNRSSMGLYVENGLVGIGTGDPKDKLDVAGNLKISGVIKPLGNEGSNGEILTRLGSDKMDWISDTVMMTIPRADIHTNRGCIQVFPKCPIDFEELSGSPIVNDRNCGPAPPEGKLPVTYGGAYRICVTDFVEP